MARIDYIPLGSYYPKKNEEGRYICQNCGKVIETKRRYKYCSEDCYWKFFRKNNHAAMRAYLIEKRGNKCQKCGYLIQNEYDIIADHIVPVALGGDHFGNEDNIQLLCPKCNKEKTAVDLGRIAKEKRIKGNTRLTQY